VGGGNIKVQNSRMCEVRGITSRNESVKKICIYKNRLEALTTRVELVLLYIHKYIAK
jgi:hypothetical protein